MTMVTNCQWCGHIHQGVCPLVKALEYHEDGTLKRVEFKVASDYPPAPGSVSTGLEMYHGNVDWQIGGASHKPEYKGPL